MKKKSENDSNAASEEDIKREHAANSTHSFVIQEERSVGVFNEVLMSSAVAHGVDGVDAGEQTESVSKARANIEDGGSQ